MLVQKVIITQDALANLLGIEVLTRSITVKRQYARMKPLVLSTTQPTPGGALKRTPT